MTVEHRQSHAHADAREKGREQRVAVIRWQKRKHHVHKDRADDHTAQGLEQERKSDDAQTQKDERNIQHQSGHADRHTEQMVEHN